MTTINEIKFDHVDPVLRERFATADASKGQVLQPQPLPRAMMLAEIKQELKPTTVTVDDILATIPSGLLRRDGWGEIFFLEDCAVFVYQYQRGGGWSVFACSVGDPSEWVKGRRVFSRK